MDGYTLDTQDEKERVIKCLEAAIRRRTSEVGAHFTLTMNCIKLYNIKLTL